MASNLGMSSWSFEAPAEHQSPPSMLTALSTVWMQGLEFSNTQSFRCFQTSHATKIIKELRPLRTSFGTALITFLHHPEKRLTEGSGTNCIKPKSWKIDAHTYIILKRANKAPLVSRSSLPTSFRHSLGYKTTWAYRLSFTFLNLTKAMYNSHLLRMSQSPINFSYVVKLFLQLCGPLWAWTDFLMLSISSLGVSTLLHVLS